jgi:hypothetical protein
LRSQPRKPGSIWSDAVLVRLGWIVAGVLALLLLGGSWLAFMDSERVSPPQSSAEIPQLVPVAQEGGDSFPGRPLDADDPRRLAGGSQMELRRGCVWGGPGQHPYTGSLTTALTAAQLPGDVVGKLAIMHDGGVISDRLEISSAGIHSADRKRDYGYTMKAMTYDGSICFDSKVNLPTKAVGAANLYELVDAKQQRYSVMVVANGGNVAVLETPVGGR